MRVGMLKLSSQATVIILVVLGLGWASMGHWSSQPHQAVVAMIFAGLVCLVMAIVSLIPIVWAANRKRQWLGEACLAATGIRMLLTLFGAILVYGLAIEPGQQVVFALWTVGFYLILLVWETITALRIAKGSYRTAAPVVIGQNEMETS